MKLNHFIAINELGLIYNSVTKETFAANTVGTDILNYLKIGLTRNQITEKLIAKYDIDEQTLENDINEFFMELHVKHLTGNY